MIVAIASGKGGTGKTTVAVNLANTAKGKIQLLDCDVEEPNADLFIDFDKTYQEEVYVTIPEVDYDLCTSCGKCSDFCRFNALKMLAGKLMVFEDMCQSCGGCFYICQVKALKESKKKIGIKQTAENKNISLIKGLLDIGSPLVPPLIRAVKEQVSPKCTVIIDSPPGTSCPMITAVEGADAVILVTEPTPFGLNDLKLAVETVKTLNIPMGVVINKYSTVFSGIDEFCHDNDINVLARIPENRLAAEASSRGELISETLPEYKDYFKDMITKLKKMTKKGIFS